MQGRITPESDLAERFRGGGLWSKRQEFEPASPEEFFLNGGMCRIEWTAGQRARDVAIQAERRIWIQRLEHWLLQAEPDAAYRPMLVAEIRRLRRCLGIKLSAEEKRERTRERMRRWRAAREASP